MKVEDIDEVGNGSKTSGSAYYSTENTSGRLRRKIIFVTG